MFSVKGDTTIATVTDLRRSAAQLLERAEAGENVVVQRNARPVGVLINYERYRALLEVAERLDDAELLLLAIQREAAIRNGEDHLVPLEELTSEYGVGEEAPVGENGEAI